MRILILSGVLLAMPMLDCAAADKPFTDAVAYCQAVTTEDAPDARYAGPAVPDWMVPALYTKDEIEAQKKSKVDPARAVVWRCMGGKIWACVQGNAPICGQANQEMAPTKAMREFCAGQPNAEVIPLSVIGHDHPMIYDWRCNGKKPAIARQIFTVDARGYPAELWKEIAPAQ
jgi:hypothetical protein